MMMIIGDPPIIFELFRVSIFSRYKPASVGFYLKKIERSWWNGPGLFHSYLGCSSSILMLGRGMAKGSVNLIE